MEDIVATRRVETRRVAVRSTDWLDVKRRSTLHVFRKFDVTKRSQIPECDVARSHLSLARLASEMHAPENPNAMCSAGMNGDETCSDWSTPVKHLVRSHARIVIRQDKQGETDRRKGKQDDQHHALHYI